MGFRKKLEGMEYIYELEVKASRYENLLKEEVRKQMPQFIKHIIKKETVDVDVVEFKNGELIVCDALTNLRSNEERHYSFDINQANPIFY